MTQYTLSTLEDLDNLDKHYAEENNRHYANVLSHIGYNEEILFCYYAIVRRLKNIFKRYCDLEICILTETKLIHSYDLSGQINEIQLSEILNLDPYSGSILVKYSLNSYRLRYESSIERESRCSYIFCDNNDLEFQTKVIRDIRKAIADLRQPSHKETRNNDGSQSNLQSSITSQLERLADLYKSGVLSDEEFKNAKAQILQTK